MLPPLIIALSGALAAGPAAAQNGRFPTTHGGGPRPIALSSIAPLTPTASSFSGGLTLALAAPSLVAPAPTRGLPALAPGALAVAARPIALVAAVRAVLPSASEPYGEGMPLTRAVGKRPAPTLSILSAASVADNAPALFDGVSARNRAVAMNASPARSPRLAAGLLRRVATVAGLIVAAPTAALAAGTPVVDTYALTLVTNYHPLAAAIAVTGGALFGLWASRSKDGSSANTGQVFSSVLSHGAIAGAGVFSLLDLTKVLFLGTAAVGLTPLTVTIATAALAQAAFTNKFLEPTTTPADRIIGAFPAVAAAFGLSLGVAALAAPSGMLALGTAALALTGTATALFVALFKPERSPSGGPTAMGRGFVLQTLMTGLALAVGDPRYAVFFFTLGMWGFVSVLVATAREAWSALPESVRKRFAR